MIDKMLERNSPEKTLEIEIKDEPHFFPHLCLEMYK